jgi:hypothetical protein
LTRPQRDLAKGRDLQPALFRFLPAMTSSKRSTVLIGLLVLLIITGLAVWMNRATTAPDSDAASKDSEKQKGGAAAGTSSLPPPPVPAPVPVVVIDPVLQQQADSLNDPDSPPTRDLEIVADFLTTYSRALGGNPIGDNADITAALTGTGGHKGRVFPPGHRTVKDGQLTDRWGTPYWFHPNAGNQMEIRSAGPDKQMFTGDDIVQNPSPPGLGVTPTAGPQEN